MSTRYVVASALATASLIVAGCGGSSKSSGQTSAETQTGSTTAQTTTGAQTQSAGASLTRTQFINKADLICARLNAIRAANKINSTQAFIQSVYAISMDERHALREMALIAPPAAMTSAWNQMIDGYKSLARTIDKIKQGIAKHEYRHINSLLIVSVKDQREVAAVAKSAGFEDCAQIA